MSTGLRLHGESWLALWARRFVSIPLFTALAALAIGLAPVWLLVTLLADALWGPRWCWPRTRALLFFCLYLACEVVGVLAAALLWLWHLGGRRGVGRYVADNALLQRVFTDSLFFGAVRIFAMRVQVEGIEEAQRGPFLLFVRHVSTADTVLAAALLANRHGLLLRYVLKRELLWDPCIDIVGRRLPNAFVERAVDKTAADVAAVERLTRDLTPDSAVLIFPEGTRFSPAKRQAALDKLLGQGRTALHAIASQFEHVMPPKLGGPLALLARAPDVDAAFLEHTGFEGAQSFSRFFRGELCGRTIHARFRRVPARDIPATDRERWLFEQWLRCEQYVAEHLQSPS